MKSSQYVTTSFLTDAASRREHRQDYELHNAFLMPPVVLTACDGVGSSTGLPFDSHYLARFLCLMCALDCLRSDCTECLRIRFQSCRGTVWQRSERRRCQLRPWWSSVRTSGENFMIIVFIRRLSHHMTVYVVAAYDYYYYFSSHQLKHLSCYCALFLNCFYYLRGIHEL